jgi:polysaccharide chain length determinant protein (PEP-CTERM system associated)
MLPGKTLKLTDVLEMAQRHIWLIVIPPVVMFFAALIFSSRVPNLYQSDMLIAIDPQRVPDVFVRSTVTMPTDLRMDALTVQALSRTALQQMIESLDLYPEERKVLPMEDVVRKMRANINVALERPREPQYGGPNSATAFHVMFTYPDPNIAAQVAQRIGSRFVEQNARDRGALAGATNRFLEGQLEDARKKLESQERRLESFRELHGKELPTQMQSNMQALNNAQLQVQSLVESMARDRDRKQMLERLYREANSEPALPVTAPNPNAGPAGSAQQQLATAVANLAALELRYKADHPDVVRAKRLISELQPKAAAEQAAATAAQTNPDASDPITSTDPTRRENLRQMRAEIESLDRQVSFKESEERRVRAEITDYQRRVEAVPGLESEWVKLTRDYDTQQAAYKELLTKSTAAQVAADLEQQDIGERFRIVDPAGVPVRPLPSMRMQYNAGGLALGLMFGVGLAALLEFRDRSFRTDADVMEVLGLPVLASVPRVETKLDKLRKRRRRVVYSLAGVTSLVVAGYVTWTLKLWNSLI